MFQKKKTPPAVFSWIFHPENPLEISLERKYTITSLEGLRGIFSRKDPIEMRFPQPVFALSAKNTHMASPEQRLIAEKLLAIKKSGGASLLQYVEILGPVITVRCMVPNTPWSETTQLIEEEFSKLFNKNIRFSNSPVPR